MIMIMLFIQMYRRVCEERKQFGWAVSPNSLCRNGPEWAPACDYFQSIKSDVTKGFFQVGNLAGRDPLATVGGPLANTQKRTWEVMVNRMWIAIPKPWITEITPKTQKQHPTENVKNTITGIQ